MTVDKVRCHTPRPPRMDRATHSHPRAIYLWPTEGLWFSATTAYACFGSQNRGIGVFRVAMRSFQVGRRAARLCESSLA